MSNSNHICKNCNNNFNGNFCNFCGQSSHIHKINFHFVIHEIQHSIFHVDGGIFYTIKELFKRPGNSIREYIDGKRVKHFKPVTYVIILSIIYLFLEHTINKNPFIEDGLLGIVDGIKNGRNINEESFKIFEWLIHNYAYTALLLIPFFSLSSFISFRKSKFNYFEHLLLNTFLFGQVTLIFLLTIPLSLLFPNNSKTEIIRVVFSIIFTFWAYFQFFNNLNKFSRILNTVLTYLIFIFLTTLILIILTRIAIV
ncbi:DUF3667 domain-containing protein [Empedobacter brevis]|uniref:DUF3667 domain-containing protein n=1 Tax=Empedobacter brevis TaxID=247 RepID=UPI00123CD798|nr:DUF3667 domain-containing protein [Empedobacter brevis]